MPALSLPEGFPPIVIHRCDAPRREPGFIVFAVGKDIRALQKTTPFEAIVALDQKGEVAWFWQSEISLMDIRYTARRTLLVMLTDGCIQELGFDGTVRRKWSSPGRDPIDADDAIPVDTRYFHHSVCELPNGNIATLSIATREYDDIPETMEDPNASRDRRLLVGDTLVEFAPDGTLVHEYDFFDILDPQRFGYGLDGPFWSITGVVPGGLDWTHANGVIHDPTDDSFIVTVRHQDCMIKIDRSSGELKWILGTPEGWKGAWRDKLLTPVGETSWHWHPHDPSILADGSIMLFDNDESGTFPPTPKKPIDDCVSRAVAYRVDQEAMTVEQVWSFGSQEAETPYSMYISGAVELPSTGNIFVTFGGITLSPDGKERMALPPQGHGSAQLYEVTRSADPEILFHAEISNYGTGEDLGWGIFRSEWVPTLG
ncbi:MAG: aryl-sulfate sulfotransferase [Proteobacteria bacterium]|nr:aryl-sulfate sulfotransferase [Pseudomonadota bacterium]